MNKTETESMKFIQNKSLKGKPVFFTSITRKYTHCAFFVIMPKTDRQTKLNIRYISHHLLSFKVTAAI